MFKSARWRSEKNKIKTVFKLQFQATLVAKLGGDGLMISVVPADVGKPTVRLEKCVVRDGSCHWKSPVYETVKFIQDPKTGKIHERVYHFVLSKGSSKAGLLGEVSIDLADYAAATKISSTSLPFKNAKSEGVLHVSIQRMPENFDQRELEESENGKINSLEMGMMTQLSNGHTCGSIRQNSIEDESLSKTSSYTAKLNGDCRVSSGSESTMSFSESSSGLDTPREHGMKISNADQDATSSLSSPTVAVPQRPASDALTATYEEHQRSQWEWRLGGSAPEVSTDNSSSSPREAILGEKSEEASDITVEKLRNELAALARQADLSGLELQSLRKQVMKERKRGQDLSREVFSLKEERDSLKKECENHKAFQKRVGRVKVENKFNGGDRQGLLEELREELCYEKELNANLRLQLQKTQESNSELILAVSDLDEMLEQKNRELLNLSKRSATFENPKDLWETNSKSGTDGDEEQKALEELVKEHGDANEAHLLEQKITDIYSELEICKRDKDEMEMQLEQLVLDYEIMKQENHDLSYKLEQSQLQEQLKMQCEYSSSYATINELETQIENLENELKNQSKELSDSLVTTNELANHVRRLEKELENQTSGFEADLETLTLAKVEQEQRAIQAEEALRRTRWQNTNLAERLQVEFRRLSVQMASAFEANESLATAAMTEASELHLQKTQLEEMLQKAKEELEFVTHHYEAKLQELSRQISSKTNQIEQMQSEIDGKSKQLEHQKKQGEESHVVLSQEILMLRADIERLTTENSGLSEELKQRKTLEAEMKQMKISLEEAEMLVQRGNLKRNELEEMIALLRKKADKSLEELNIWRSLKDEKESIVRNLQLELEALKSQCDELKHSLFEDELEKEKLRKQVLQLKGDIKKKEDAIGSIEKKLKDSNGRVTVLDGPKATLRNNKFAPVPRGSKEAVNMKEKIKFLEAQIKLKETALETSTKSFLEKEKELQNKIEEQERRLEELNCSSIRFHELESQKVTKDMEDVTSNDCMPKEMRNAVENLSTTLSMHSENGSAVSLMERNDVISSDRETRPPAFNLQEEKNFVELLNEMEFLKARNKSMESELKDMQGRYSEISLKFAEVEGERQQLVMTVRSLKNVKKC